MKLWKQLLALFALPTVLLLGAATTQLDLANQVRNVLSIVNGGTGLSTLAAHCVIIGQGSATPHMVCPVALGDVLTDNGPGSDPSFQPTAATLNFASEVPVGSINGTNFTYTLSHTPNPSSSLDCYLNGLHQSITSDFTLSTAVITYLAAPIVADTLVCNYRY